MFFGYICAEFTHLNFINMTNNDPNFEVIIIGGSVAGLSAAMSLARSGRKILIVDSSNPCNKKARQAHNVITLDGVSPLEIVRRAKEQLAVYPTVQFLSGEVVKAVKTVDDFELSLSSGAKLKAQKLVLATGVRDLLPDIPGFAEAWGVSIFHCPYCHGYEVFHKPLGVWANGENGFEFGKVIHNWSSQLTLYTNEKSTLTAEQAGKFAQHGIRIQEQELVSVEQQEGHINLVFKDGSKESVAGLFARVPFEQHSDLAVQLGCEMTDFGLIATDEFEKTTVHGVYAAGDNATMFRSISMAMAAGTKAGAVLNRELIHENF
jgi:thioredoxin reductase